MKWVFWSQDVNNESSCFVERVTQLTNTVQLYKGHWVLLQHHKQGAPMRINNKAAAALQSEIESCTS